MRLELVYETHSTSVDNDRGNTTGWLPGELSEILPRAGPGPRASADGTTAPPWSTRPISAARSRRLRSRSPARASRFVTRLRECDYGDLNDAPVETVTAVRCRHIDEPFPAGGSYRQVVERTRSFLAEVVARHHGARILVIAYSANSGRSTTS